MRYVIDARVFIWFVSDNSRLSRNADLILSNPENNFILPATAFGEICWIAEHRNIRLTIESIVDALDSDDRFVVWPLTRAIIEKSNLLATINEMHDRQIVATALELSELGEPVSLVTRDQNITESGLLPVIW